MQTDMEYLEDTLRMGVAGGFIDHSERENIVKYLAEPGVCAPLVLGANMHAACSRTSLICFVLGLANAHWDKKSASGATEVGLFLGWVARYLRDSIDPLFYAASRRNAI